MGLISKLKDNFNTGIVFIQNILDSIKKIEIELQDLKVRVKYLESLVEKK